MKSSRGRILVVLITGLMLFAGSAIGSYAANGGPLLLGKNNKATKTTKLKNTKGTALSLKSKAGTPVLKVSNNTPVVNLNADLVDGKHSTDLQNKSYVFNLTAPSQTQNYVFFSLAGLPAGKYLFNSNVSVAVTGAASFVACFILPAVGLTSVPNVALGSTDGFSYVVDGNGYIDTTGQAMRFGCQRGGGTNMTIPSNPLFPAQIVFTRVDDVTTGAVAGTAATGPKGGGVVGLN